MNGKVGAYMSASFHAQQKTGIIATQNARRNAPGRKALVHQIALADFQHMVYIKGTLDQDTLANTWLILSDRRNKVRHKIPNASSSIQQSARHVK